MSTTISRKRKIINDPVYGFITIRHPFILELIDHPWFQRLRRVAQMGLAQMVYPGALHNRFQHAIGAMHLMQNAIDEIRLRNHEITQEEEVSLLAAILLHDIGHGPFSHALEFILAKNVHHEYISSLMMEKLNRDFEGKLSMAIEIFNNRYHKKFLHELVSSQLDMDRLDYLTRDSFFSGVVEGQVGSERILKMLDVANDHLVVEEKGIYSIEKFILARRFMYWQVYFHKTSISAEHMLRNTLKRARQLALNGTELFCTPSLRYFLYHEISEKDFEKDGEALQHYAQLDDFDLTTSLKVWQKSDDRVLSTLASSIVQRNLFKIELRKEKFDSGYIAELKKKISTDLDLSPEETDFFVISGRVDNKAYNSKSDSIKVLMKNGMVREAAELSDHLNLAALSETVEKNFVAHIRSGCTKY